MSDYIFPFLNFFVFLFLLYWFGRKPLGEMARAKHEAFEKACREANRSREEAERELKLAEQRMAGLEKELTLFKEQARESLEREVQKIAEQGKKQIQHLREEAERFSRTELEAQRKALRQEVWLQTQSLVEKELTGAAAKKTVQAHMDRQITRLETFKVGGASS